MFCLHAMPSFFDLHACAISEITVYWVWFY